MRHSTDAIYMMNKCSWFNEIPQSIIFKLTNKILIAIQHTILSLPLELCVNGLLVWLYPFYKYQLGCKEVNER